MKKIISILMLLMLIGAGSAAWYPRSEDYTTTGDVNADNGVFTGNITVSGASGISADITGNVTAAGTVQAEQLTSTDDAIITDDLVVDGAARIDEASTIESLTVNTTLDVNGDTTTDDITVDADKTLAVTTADKLTVGGKIVPQELVVVWPMSASSVDESVFIPTGDYNVTAVEIRYSVAASSGPTNVTLTKCTVGEAPESGDAITSVMNLAGSANTVGSYTPIVNVQSITAADTLCLDYTGTMTALAGGTVTITLQRV